MNQKYRYVTVDDVYRTSGIREEVINRDDVENHISRAETFMCRVTKNIYYKYNLEDQDILSGTDNSITQTGTNWITNEWRGQYVKFTSGTGSVEYNQIISNTADTLVLRDNFISTPDASGSFSIFYVPKSFNPFKKQVLDGNNRKDMLLEYYPINKIDSLSIDNNNVSPETVNIWNYGKIELTSDSEYQVFIKTRPKLINISYWYGVPELTEDAQRMVELKAALQLLSQQMGGTFDVPSTFSLPDLNVSIGQAYVNIKGTVDVLQKEYDELLKRIRIYSVFA